ncbi:MAG: hypothetical protein ACR2PL_14795, partial [Dehalococcoidia bacterium]
AIPIDPSISPPIVIMVRVYLRRIPWARRNDPDEYRIQTLGTLTSPVGGKHMLLGYYNFTMRGIGQTPVFAGFDPMRHAAPFGCSNSLYIRMESLSSALEHGMWIDNHNPGDPVIAFRAENLPDYLLRMSYLHGLSVAGIATENGGFSRSWPLLDDTARVANQGNSSIFRAWWTRASVRLGKLYAAEVKLHSREVVARLRRPVRAHCQPRTSAS